MKRAILLFANFASVLAFAQVFTLVDSIQFSNAQIWGVCSDDGGSLAVTTIFNPGPKPHIYLRKVDYSDITQQSTPVALTFDSDFTSITNLTDHKSMIWNNEIYVAFSTQGDQDLYLFKTDINGNRIGNIVTVVSGSADPTNDMILTNNGTSLFVMHFDPPNQHHVYEYDADLNLLGGVFSTTTLGHNNIGSAAFEGGQFYLFTGSTFGFSSNLIVTEWNADWTPISGSSQNLITSTAGDGNWFATGSAYDVSQNIWLIGMNHISSSETIGQEHIDLVAFDAAFSELERIHVTDQNYTRPHFVLKNGYLYVTYDQPGAGVYLHKYMITGVWGLGETSNSTISVYPNPAEGNVTIENKNGNEPCTLFIYDLQGNLIYTHPDFLTGSLTLNMQPGVYMLKMESQQHVFTQKLVLH